MNKRDFAIAHRVFTFLDEWLFYLTAFILLALYIEYEWQDGKEVSRETGALPLPRLKAWLLPWA